jgi:hypothetical protein
MSDLGSFQGVDPVSFEGVSSVTATPSVALGTRRMVNGEEYVYFYSTVASSVTQGMAMTTSGLSGYSLTRSTTAEIDAVMCFVKHADVPANNYAWGLVRGLVSAQLVSAISAGLPIQVGADGVVSTYCTAAKSFPAYILGKSVASGVSSTSILCYVKCFG